jgi:DNA invertase Pin-like site-specific DNA recombinase
MSGKANRQRAVAYLRTSSAANVGPEKDSLARQGAAIEAYAKANRIDVVAEFYDPAVSGAEPLDQRPGFAALLRRVAGDGIDMVLIEDAARFARDLAIQLTGHDRLRGMGVELVPANAPDHFREDTPTAVLVRQVLGAIAQFEKAQLVAKLKGARDRKRAEAGKCEGRKSVAERWPEAAAEARELRRKRGKRGRLSLRAIAAKLAAANYVNSAGKPFGPSTVRSMLASR